MGIADFALLRSGSWKSHRTPGQATEITLEHRHGRQAAVSKLGHELFTLGHEAEVGFCMKDSEGHAVLTAQSHDSTEVVSVIDRHGQVICTMNGAAFQWEGLHFSWISESLGFISDAKFVIRQASGEGSPRSPAAVDSPRQDLAELELPSGTSKIGFLRVPTSVVESQATPPLGLILFMAMILNAVWLGTSAMQRITFTPSWS